MTFNSNSTPICEAYIGNLKIVYPILDIVLCTAILFGQILVVAVIVKTAALQTPNGYFLIQLAIGDILLAVVLAVNAVINTNRFVFFYFYKTPTFKMFSGKLKFLSAFIEGGVECRGENDQSSGCKIGEKVSL